jgi:hypothetical protein
MPIFLLCDVGGEYSITDDGRVKPKHVLIEFKKWICYFDGQKNKYSVLNDCSRMLKYNIGKLLVNSIKMCAFDIDSWTISIYCIWIFYKYK